MCSSKTPSRRPSTMSDLALQIEALLFALGRPLSRTEIQKFLAADPHAVAAAITELRSAPRGVALVDDGTELELRTSPAAASLIERVRKDEYSRDIGRAGAEALSAILYRGPLTRAEIDFIRGVNSSQTLRTLLLRGLVRRVENDKDRALPAGRRGSFLYEPTTELLAQLGVASAADLPDFVPVREQLAQLEAAYRAKEEAS